MPILGFKTGSEKKKETKDRQQLIENLKGISRRIGNACRLSEEMSFGMAIRELHENMPDIQEVLKRTGDKKWRIESIRHATKLSGEVNYVFKLTPGSRKEYMKNFMAEGSGNPLTKEIYWLENYLEGKTCS